MSHNEKGFSLLELLVVILMIGILTSVALPNYKRSVQRARVAEALNLSRAIYDSCERLAWENRYNSCAAAVAADDGEVTFRKLDITVKGTFNSQGTTLSTDNFKYTLPTQANSNVITIQPLKGAYAGAVTIIFNGEPEDGKTYFSCTADSGNTEAAEACRVWGVSAWNK